MPASLGAYRFFYFGKEFLVKNKMKKRLIFGLSIIPLLAYLTSFSKDTFIFILALNISLWLLFTSLLAVALFNLAKIIPRSKRPASRMPIFVVIIFIAVVCSLVIFRQGVHNSIQLSPYESLKSLPYLTWSPAKAGDIQKAGVTRYNRNLSYTGVNIYNSRNLSTAYLMDMSGGILHEWSHKIDKTDSWQDIKLCENGDLLAIVKDKMLICLDWDSNIKWIKRMRFHHDVAVAKDKRIWALAWKDEVVFVYGLPLPILNEYIVVLSADGEVEKELSLFKILKGEIAFGSIISIYRNMVKPDFIRLVLMRKMSGRPILDEDAYYFDVFHNNTVEIINRDIAGLCKDGDILISPRNLDLIGIVDVKREKLIWSWGKNNLSRQHHPALLDNQNILVFDNGVGRGYSRLVEINPYENKIVWEYKTSPPGKLYSAGSSSGQRLPNGNSLITDSDAGYAFEITQEGEVVWEFYNPQVRKGSNLRAVIASMERIPA